VETSRDEREMGMRPGWVGGLVEESFFVGCAAHENRKKNEKNIFCLGCCASICPHCAPAHRHHLLIQVQVLHCLLAQLPVSCLLAAHHTRWEGDACLPA